jgi:hypothetical protein
MSLNILRTLKAGNTPAARKVLSANNTTPIPTALDAGVLSPGANVVWATVRVTGPGDSAFVVSFYVLDPISQLWAQQEFLTYGFEREMPPGTYRLQLPVQGGPVRIQPVVVGLEGSPTLIEVWLAEVSES